MANLDGRLPFEPAYYGQLGSREVAYRKGVGTDAQEVFKKISDAEIEVEGLTLDELKAKAREIGIGENEIDAAIASEENAGGAMSDEDLESVQGGFFSSYLTLCSKCGTLTRNSSGKCDRCRGKIPL